MVSPLVACSVASAGKLLGTFPVWTSSGRSSSAWCSVLV
jgi:hypothetical protein